MSKLNAFLAAVPSNASLTSPSPSPITKPTASSFGHSNSFDVTSSASIRSLAQKLNDLPEAPVSNGSPTKEVSNQEEAVDANDNAAASARPPPMLIVKISDQHATDVSPTKQQPRTPLSKFQAAVPARSPKPMPASPAPQSKPAVEAVDEAGPLRRLASAQGYHHRRVSTDSMMFNRFLRKQAHRDIDADVVQHFSSIPTVTLSRSHARSTTSVTTTPMDESEDNNETFRGVDPLELMDQFRRGETISVAAALDIIKHATNLMTLDPNVITLRAPFTVVGDLHGQYQDLVQIFRAHGVPSPSNQFLFLGDYVDRGLASCEIILLLLAFKSSFPAHVHLLRGNHECRSLSTFYGFRAECLQKYGAIVYNRAIQAFESMPLAAVLETARGRFLAVHGGISPDLKRIDDINDSVNRFMEPEPKGALCDLLWSDPAKDEKQENDWAPNLVRGCSYTFNARVCRRFLETNNLVAIIRAHELEEDGYREHFQSATSAENAPAPVITVFSAPEYCNTNQNVGATLYVPWEQAHSYRQHKRCVDKEKPYGGVSEDKAMQQFLKDKLPFLPLDFHELVALCRQLRSNVHPTKSSTAVANDKSGYMLEQSAYSRSHASASNIHHQKSAVVVEEDEIDRDDDDEENDEARTRRSRASRRARSSRSHTGAKSTADSMASDEVTGFSYLQGSILSRNDSRHLQQQQRRRSIRTSGHAEERRRRRQVGGYILCPGLQSLYEWLFGRLDGVSNPATDVKPVVVRSGSLVSMHGNNNNNIVEGPVSISENQAAEVRGHRRYSFDVRALSGNSAPSKHAITSRGQSFQQMSGAPQMPAKDNTDDDDEEEEEEEDVHPVTQDDLDELQHFYRRSLPCVLPSRSFTNSSPTKSNIEIFTNEQWKALRLYFGVLDVEGNGVLMEESFVVLLAEQDSDAYATEEELELLLEQIDCNGDGIITEQDFLLFAYRAFLRWKKKNHS
ncbi:TPA: hypothetical protein N0F65_011074 [Lagenidium giganteum]|uniref:Serine/threonine-protein phosphatase n=1 Tax=Lagenidium giganteum TaxID=4803 RepID=A0AAV2ZAS2_9STRA|nr:TPA: hypothetical protein N0F65_011074 [Lagenidium giganteum]